MVSTLPSSCNPEKGRIVAVAGTPTEYYLCTATNTWSEYVPGKSTITSTLFRNLRLTTSVPAPAKNFGAKEDYRLVAKTSVGTTQTDQFVIPYGTRYDRPGLTFPDLKQFGIHQNPGGGWFSINANNIALGAQNGIVGMVRDSQLAWGASISTPIDCPPCQYGGIGMPAPGILGITSANSANALVLGGTWRATPNTPPQLTDQVNNYNPGAPSYFQRWSADMARRVTGLTFTTPQVSGQVHQIWNVGTEDLVLVYESASSFAANRFKTTTGTDLIITPDQCASVIYDGVSRRWRAHLCP
ncbi:MAG TPA: hypothetical protein PKC13_01160 [Blastocatellia bacterium]|nr:hypothetical protein [Blastocatellia bacterium]HMV85702.1 hypothetical protein [Blastocatellia bacterium]HMX24202.1 hypothetical protein [Blastocatellia bacterium]HMY72181.1 hypothetical protein [Blastocatellia bacterium]HNG31545.1 hypothetical protein [Blastocatellia bacterium]